MRNRDRTVLIFLLVVCLPGLCYGYELRPLSTRNLSPVVVGFGLPTQRDANILPRGTSRVGLKIDVVNNSVTNSSSYENLHFDGETNRTALSYDYGLDDRFEVGLELPYIAHQGGGLDSFIEGWHELFNLPQGGRDQVARNQLDYHYAQAGGDSIQLDSSTSGVGGLSLRAGLGIWQAPDQSSAVALRANLKLPTGDSKKLTDSGSTDLSLTCHVSRQQTGAYGSVLVYGSAGGLFTTDGDLLPEQRQTLVGLVGFGVGWSPGATWGLQAQFDGHSEFYRHSNLKEMSQFSGLLSLGGQLALSPNLQMEIAVTEDVLTDTVPDVGFHLALRYSFD